MAVTSKKRSFSLMELIVVIIIVAVLAIIAFPQYKKAQENALDNEAKANLKLIQAAEKVYKMEGTGYIACPDITAINNNLFLAIPTATPNWNYRVNLSGPNFTATAGRRPANTRAWCVQQNTETPYSCSW